MNKTKLLTSLATLALVLSLGACNSSDEGETSIEDSGTSSETSGTSSDFEGDSCEQNYGATNPGELIEKAYEEDGYSVTLYIQEMVSEPVSPSDYSSGNYDYDDLFDSMTTTLYTIKLYYSKEAVMCELYRGESTYFEGILLVNDYWLGYGEVVRAFTRYNLTDNWNFRGSWYYYWQDHRYSLFYAYEEGVTGDDFTVYSIGYIGNEYTIVYSASDDAATTLAYSIGLDWWFTSISSEISSMYYNGIYFMPGTQSMLAEYFELYWGYESYTSSNLVLVEELYDAYIYDVGTTDFSQDVADAMALI